MFFVIIFSIFGMICLFDTCFRQVIVWQQAAKIASRAFQRPNKTDTAVSRNYQTGKKGKKSLQKNIYDLSMLMSHYKMDTLHYYIDTDEIPGFFLLLKNHIFIVRSEDTIFIFHV